MKKVLAVIVCAALALGAQAKPHGGGGGGGHHSSPAPRHHSGGHHHHSGGFAAGLVGGALVGGLVYEAVKPHPQVVTPAPVVVQQPVVIQQPTVVQEPVYQMQNVWVEGRYVDQVQSNGTVIRVWQPGHYEQRQVQVGVRSTTTY